jgi:peptidoglycan hydrolase-like protein with peptidoglycan-binding domain
MSAHDVFCFHTMVGSLAGTRSMFLRNGYGGTESHFGTGAAGELEQWQDVAFTADANLDGNGYVISVENADFGAGFPKWNTNDGSAVPAFTDAQIATLIRLGVAAALPGDKPGSLHADCPRDWACYRDGIPPRLIPDTKRGRRGFAYHAQGVPGNELVSGGVAWSSARGKVCPGRRRIEQIKSVILPGIVAALESGQAEPARKPEPAKPAAPADTVKPPAFPLPAGHYYGEESSDSHCHSGYYAKDQAGIRTWQAQMKRRGWTIDVDGHFGAQSADVARSFQREKKLGVDGLVGARTWAASWTAKLT